MVAGAIVYPNRTKVNQCSRCLRTEHETFPDSKITIFSKSFCGAFFKKRPRPPHPLSKAFEKNSPRDLFVCLVIRFQNFACGEGGVAAGVALLDYYGDDQFGVIVGSGTDEKSVVTA